MVLFQSDWESQIAVYALYRLGISFPAQLQYLFINNVTGLSQQRVMSLRAYTHFYLTKPILLENVKRATQILQKEDLEDVSIDTKSHGVSAGERSQSADLHAFDERYDAGGGAFRVLRLLSAGYFDRSFVLGLPCS